MKRFLSLTAICVAIALVSLPLAYGQQDKAGPPQDRPAGPPQDKPAAQAEKTFDGQLTKVDAAKKIISVKGAGNAPEMNFAYTDQTQVVGPQKDVQGLASQAGAQLKITYRDQGENHVATKIEIAEKK
jgi:hypothetical protein